MSSHAEEEGVSPIAGTEWGQKLAKNGRVRRWIGCLLMRNFMPRIPTDVLSTCAEKTLCRRSKPNQNILDCGRCFWPWDRIRKHIVRTEAARLKRKRASRLCLPLRPIMLPKCARNCGVAVYTEELIYMLADGPRMAAFQCSSATSM